MNASTSYSQGSTSIIGAEPFPIVTHSLGLTANQGLLAAGTLVDVTGTKLVGPTATAAFGVLAIETQTHVTEQVGATVYTSGSFIEERIKDANTAITFDQAAKDSLRTKNIYLERSIGF
jgi:predicted alpha/beta hydrolase family esterase